jgi:hypothetical protein
LYEVVRWIGDLLDGRSAGPPPHASRALLERVTVGGDLEEFLTLPAYEQLD